MEVSVFLLQLFKLLGRPLFCLNLFRACLWLSAVFKISYLICEFSKNTSLQIDTFCFQWGSEDSLRVQRPTSRPYSKTFEATLPCSQTYATYYSINHISFTFIYFIRITIIFVTTKAVALLSSSSLHEFFFDIPLHSILCEVINGFYFHYCPLQLIPFSWGLSTYVEFFFFLLLELWPALNLP